MAEELRDDNNTNETEEAKGSVGNTRLPFGLCAKYHISLPSDATPRDAWNALRRGVGLTPDKVYAELKKEKEGTSEKKEESKNIKSREEVLNTNESLKTICDNCEEMGVESIYPTEKQYKSDEEIIKQIAGGDLTRGSCMSAALAYAGCKAGFYITDFRGGDSCYAVAHYWRETFKIFDGETTEANNGYTATEEVLQKMEEGKEYILVSGKHAAVVRKKDGLNEYLELQSPNAEENKFKPLTKLELKHRFGTQASRSVYGMKLTLPAGIIPIDNIKNKKDEAYYLFSYLNTNGQNEQKGGFGSVK